MYPSLFEVLAFNWNIYGVHFCFRFRFIILFILTNIIPSNSRINSCGLRFLSYSSTVSENEEEGYNIGRSEERNNLQSAKNKQCSIEQYP